MISTTFDGPSGSIRTANRQDNILPSIVRVWQRGAVSLHLSALSSTVGPDSSTAVVVAYCPMPSRRFLEFKLTHHCYNKNY